MKDKLNNERGMVIVEATIVFPVMFLVIFLMIFVGNAYLQKCRVEAVINKLTIAGAAYCADPMLDSVDDEGKIPGFDTDVKPYRYLVGGMDDIIKDIKVRLQTEISNISTGLFSEMKPTGMVYSEPEFNNYFIHSTFSMEIQYEIVMPIRLLGQTDNVSLKLSARADIPVSDSPELIRNIDMIEDYMEKYGIMDKIDEAKKKISDMASKVGEFMKMK